MNEYRRAKRRKANQAIEVVDTMTEQVIGHLSNLSESGMLVISEQALVNDALYQFRITLSLDGSSRDIEIGAHELWADDAAASGQVWSGLRFIDMAPEDAAFIRDWVDSPGSQYV